MTDEPTIPEVPQAFAGATATRVSIKDLTDAVDRLSEEATDIRAQLRSRTRALWTAVTVGGILLAVVLAAAVVVTFDNSKAIERNNSKICPIILALRPLPGDAPPAGTPSQQERSLRIRETFERLAKDPSFGCK